MTDRRIVRIDPSLLRVCHAVMTDARRRDDDPSSPHPDRLIALVADRQDGVVVREQLEALGIGRGAIAHRRRRGLLRALHKGVFVWGRLDTPPRTRARAAVFAAGEGALISHVWALALWGLTPSPDRPVDVTVCGRRARCEGIRGHESGSLRRADRRLLAGIPVTAPARALLDSAAHLTPRELADAVERATVQRLLTKRELLAALDRTPRRAGVAALRALAEDQAFTRSIAERRLVALLSAAKLTEPALNAIAEGWEVDALWAHERVALEFDSYGFHATRAAFERDRRKTSDLTRNRYLVLRTTWTELTKQPYALIARIAEALALHPYAREDG